jgi:hypothetical protein
MLKELSSLRQCCLFEPIDKEGDGNSEVEFIGKQNKNPWKKVVWMSGLLYVCNNETGTDIKQGP